MIFILIHESLQTHVRIQTVCTIIIFAHTTLCQICRTTFTKAHVALRALFILSKVVTVSTCFKTTDGVSTFLQKMYMLGTRVLTLPITTRGTVSEFHTTIAYDGSAILYTCLFLFVEEKMTKVALVHL
jgi:hypothetical protein